MADICGGSFHSMKVIAEEFNNHLPREIVKLFIGIYLTVYVIVEKALPFTQRLNGGKEITALVVLLIGYLILLLASGRKCFIEFGKGKVRRRRATADFAFHLLMALEVLLNFCYSIGGGSVLVILCIAVSVIAALLPILIFFNLDKVFIMKDDKFNQSEENLFLGSGMLGIIKHSLLMNLTIWIYYGAMDRYDLSENERYESFVEVIKIFGATLSGLYTSYLVLVMIIITCGDEKLDRDNIMWYFANRIITIAEYAMLLIYFIYSSVAVFIIFECIYLLKFTLTIIYLCRNDYLCSGCLERLNNRNNRILTRQSEIENGEKGNGEIGNGDRANNEQRTNKWRDSEQQGRPDQAPDQGEVRAKNSKSRPVCSESP